jgi:hypothetical protein
MPGRITFTGAVLPDGRAQYLYCTGQADQDSSFLPNDRFSSPISLPQCEYLYKSTGLSFIRPLWIFVDLLESFDTSWEILESTGFKSSCRVPVQAQARSPSVRNFVAYLQKASFDLAVHGLATNETHLFSRNQISRSHSHNS